MRRRVLITATVVLVALGTGAWLGLAQDPEQPGPGERGHPRCPSGVTDIGPDAVARATDATLAEAETLFRVKDRRGMRVTSAQLATNRNRGAYARVTCGRRVFRRTVVVDVVFPAERPSASLSQSTVLVSPVRGEWTVWAIVH